MARRWPTALSPALQGCFPACPNTVADTIALVIDHRVICYVSIVLGELTAKRLALQRAETFALAWPRWSTSSPSSLGR